MLGIPELMIVVVIGLVYIVPIVIAIWAVLTLHRTKTAVDAMRVTLERVEQAVSRR
jgi:hypothetical protein